MSKQKGLGFPIATAAGLALTGITAGDKATNFLKNNWKWIAGLTVVGVGGWLAYDKWFREKDGLELEYNPNFEPSTLTTIEAQIAADTLYDAMKDPGTDEDLIFETFDTLTHNDFVKISNRFGKKYYSKNLGTAGGSLLNEKYGLYEWLQFELNPEEFAQIAQIVAAKPKG